MRFALIVFLASAFASPSLAQTEASAPASTVQSPVPTAENAEGALRFGGMELGAGVLGFVSGNFIAKPTGSYLDQRPYPGFGGVGGGGGLSHRAPFEI